MIAFTVRTPRTDCPRPDLGRLALCAQADLVILDDRLEIDRRHGEGEVGIAG